MNTREMIAVMQAYEDGKQIEREHWRRKGWEDDDTPIWNWYTFNYRIKATKKPVDLSVLIDSGIDCEFADETVNNKWPLVGKLGAILNKNTSYWMMGYGNMIYCRPRMDHIHAWQGGECPLPEGFMIKAYRRSEDISIRVSWADSFRWDNMGIDTDIIAFEVIGLADGYCYPWECE